MIALSPNHVVTGLNFFKFKNVACTIFVVATRVNNRDAKSPRRWARRRAVHGSWEFWELFLQAGERSAANLKPAEPSKKIYLSEIEMRLLVK